MRRFLRILTVVTFLFTSGLIIGCGGPKDEVLDYDPKLSEQKSAEYAKQQKEAMEKAQQQMQQGSGSGNPYQR